MSRIGVKGYCGKEYKLVSMKVIGRDSLIK